MESFPYNELPEDVQRAVLSKIETIKDALRFEQTLKASKELIKGWFRINRSICVALEVKSSTRTNWLGWRI